MSDLHSLNQCALDLIDDIINHWSLFDEYEDFYINKLAPKLVKDQSKGDDIERNLFKQLRPLLENNEWNNLPSLISNRRAQILYQKELQRKEVEAKKQRLLKNEIQLTHQLRRNFNKLAGQVAQQNNFTFERLGRLNKVNELLNKDYLSVDSYYFSSCSDIISFEDFRREKNYFFDNWFALHKSIESQVSDPQQLAAIASVSGDKQIIARAGSGKTSTLVNRAYFLQKHCRVNPDEMILLAFNKKAAEEMETRLGKLLDDQPPFVMTFHALAHALVHPEQNLIHDSSDGRDLALSRFVQGIIDDRRRDPNFVGRIRQVMVDHFKADWDRIEDGGFNLSKDELLAYRRSLQRETLHGEFVKSFGEKIIANLLFEHQVPYLYEPLERGSLQNYHPDFILKCADRSGVAIEYFGMAGDPDYDAMSDEKRRYWKSRERAGWKLIECGPDDIRDYGVDGFLNKLRNELEKEGFVFRRMSEHEIWQQVSKRAIDRFTKTTQSFIARCRKQELTPDDLQERILHHQTPWKVEADFLDIMVPLYRDYLMRLDADDKEDFDGLMHRATNAVRNGNTIFHRFMKKQRGDLTKLRFMLIDEYQDFSTLFHSLVEAIRQINPGLELFCVGDDWQAINGFAGSDLVFFEKFTSYFSGAERLNISTNYRSKAAIVDVGNAVMDGHPNPAVAYSKEHGEVLLTTISEFKASPNEEIRHGSDLVTPMVLRLTADALAQNKNIVLLSRTNLSPTRINYKAYQGQEDNPPAEGIKRFRNLIRSYFPVSQRSKIKVSTTHGFKGLQGDVVIVLDAISGCYPLIHQDWIFLRLLGESVQSITDESRRLFYVALTRAIDTLVIFTERDRKSPFLEDIENQMYLIPIDWNMYPAVSASSDRLKVYVGNQNFQGSEPTMAIKDLLKQEGYRISKLYGNWFSWMKTFPTNCFSLENLTNSTWSPNAVGIEVKILDDQDHLVGNYLLDQGKWTVLKEFKAS